MTARAHRSGSFQRSVSSPPCPGEGSVDQALLSGAARVAAALTDRGGPADQDGWLSVVGSCQVLINTLTAVQDTALAQAARRESTWCDHGTVGETVHAPGRITLDAADLAAPLLGATHAQAQRRLELAVRLAANRVPATAEQRELPETSGLRGLHTAMAEGRLDGYRASVVAFELDLAPADVADAVVTALGPHLGDDSSALRQRTRRLIARISPDLLRQRAERARAATGLRRWVAEPGVDTWLGTFPSEDAATAWAAIDQLAHDLVTAGTCTSVEQARGKALTDLVTGHATVDVQIVLTVPADTTPAGTAGADTIRTGTPATTLAHGPADDPGAGEAGRVDRGHAEFAAGRALLEANATGEATTTGAAAATHGAPHGRDCEDDLVQVHGARPSEPLLVRRGWLRDHLARQPHRPRRGRVKVRPVFVPCDPLTGARLDPAEHLSTDAYRPGAELTTLVRARDGRCRFPGCCVAARFCDLDHVRAWPLGPTAAHNLLTLCRRHHRIKQRPGWRLRLALDGTATWTDPTGSVRTTAPLDALQVLVLAPEPTHGTPSISAAADAPTSTWSLLETVLELRGEHAEAASEQGYRHHRAHRRCFTAAEVRTGFTRLRAHRTFSDAPPF